METENLLFIIATVSLSLAFICIVVIVYLKSKDNKK